MTDTDVGEDKPVYCPICLKEGRHFRFMRPILGWHQHMGPWKCHPNWNAGVKDPVKRKALFKKEFPDFFKLGRSETRKRERTERSHLNRDLNGSEGRTRPGVLMSNGEPAALTSSADQTVPSPHRCPTCGGPVRLTFIPAKEAKED